jgi:hypothetical protein
MRREIQVGDRVTLERLPETVRAEDPDDDVFRQCLGQELEVVSIEENGDLELNTHRHSERFLSIFVPTDCVKQRS